MSAYIAAKILLGDYRHEESEYKEWTRRTAARNVGLPDDATREEIDAAECARAKRASEAP